ALTEVMDVQPGERILDIGCGTGTNGIIAARRAGPDAQVTFVDSNVRALALTEINARNNGLTSFETVASSGIEGTPAEAFDLALANPPYFAQQAIAALFIERARDSLKRGGRLYLVTKQVSHVAPLVEEAFGDVRATERRGYVVLSAQRS
ncbi:MAG TPA: methyltransferase, partial [Gemmataceae bacterium]|nr:methyltransferase [Gemmataceae bacterium]